MDPKLGKQLGGTVTYDKYLCIYHQQFTNLSLTSDQPHFLLGSTAPSHRSRT